MNRHERRAQAASRACRIRARRLSPGDECLFCAFAAAGNPKAALALVYFMGHQDEATLNGPTLCDACLAALKDVSEKLTAAQGGEFHDMNAPGAGKT